jgi:hypothetical protein
LTGKKSLNLYQRCKDAFATRGVRMLALYGAMTLLGGVIVVRAIAPLAVSLIQQWSRSGVELRSQQIFNSIRPTLTELLPAGQTQALLSFSRMWRRTNVLSPLGFATRQAGFSFPQSGCRQAFPASRWRAPKPRVSPRCSSADARWSSPRSPFQRPALKDNWSP